MASPLSTSSLFSPSSCRTKSPTFTFARHLNNEKVSLSPWLCQLGQIHFRQWSGLSSITHLGVSIAPKSLKLERRKKKCRGLVVHASLFGVGAPEALVIGVVALLVFGPKGLAEVARNLGKTLRAFQPTIRELQDVSREFKTTLEREIGLDDIPTSGQNRYGSYGSNGIPTPPPASTSADTSGTTAESNVDSLPKRAYTSEDYLKLTEEQLKASALQQQGQTPSTVEIQNAAETQPLTPAEDQREIGTRSESEDSAAAMSPSQNSET